MVRRKRAASLLQKIAPSPRAVTLVSKIEDNKRNYSPAKIKAVDPSADRVSKKRHGGKDLASQEMEKSFQTHSELSMQSAGKVQKHDALRASTRRHKPQHDPRSVSEGGGPKEVSASRNKQGSVRSPEVERRVSVRGSPSKYRRTLNFEMEVYAQGSEVKDHVSVMDSAHKNKRALNLKMEKRKDSENTNKTKQSHIENSKVQGSVAVSTNFPKRKNKKTSRKVEQKKHVLQMIRKYQTSTELLLPRSSFARVCREIFQQYAGPDFRVAKDALECLQESAETYLVQLFEDAYLCTLHARRKTLMNKDLRLARRIGGRSGFYF